jgi:hypothetical protein
MPEYRTGNHWGVTIVRQSLVPDDNYGEHDELVAVVVNGDRALAERICALLNGERPALVCVCNDPPPTVHGKNQPATRPPGWSCPRHGTVI